MSQPAALARPSRLSAAAVLLVAAVAWAGTVLWAQAMGIMPGTMGMTLALFVVMWTLMMAAMMVPSAMPMITLYARTVRGTRWARMTAFGLGYLVVWGLTGIPAYGIAWLAGRLASGHPVWATGAAVAIFAAAGLYQITPLKHRCLQHCRSPLAFLMHYGSFQGRSRDLRAGAHHGGYCLACCWALMALLVAFGVMNVGAMVVLAAVVAVEKQWSHGEGFARLVGVAAFGLAVLVVFYPGLAPGLYTAPMTPMGM